MTDHHRIAAKGIAVVLDLANGHLVHLEVEHGGRQLAPLHRAPWADDADALPTGTNSGLSRLSGDFFCAPFSTSDIEPAPVHGWSANAPWALVDHAPLPGGVRATFRLTRSILGAAVEKALILRDNHPFLYQEHRLVGGAGELSFAHHTMTHMAAGGRLDFSSKRFAQTPDQPLETDPARGRHALAYPAETADLSAFPLHDGTRADLHEYPPAERHEDFLTLAEAGGAALGWTTVSRHAERDMVLVLKNPRAMPVTMLWMSNGGRDYAPWNGRHLGVLGIEDGCTAIGHRASIGDNALTRAGVPTCVELGGTIVLRQVIGALSLTETRTEVMSLTAADGHLAIARNGLPSLRVPFDHGFLENAESVSPLPGAAA